MTHSPFEHRAVHGRVLILEQTSVFREMQSLLLRGSGYLVTATEDPLELLQLLGERPFDVVVLNSDRVAANSAEFIGLVRQASARPAIIFASGAVTVEVARSATQAGAALVVQRPIEPAMLLERIDQLVGLGSAPAAPATPPSHRPASAPEVTTTPSGNRLVFAADPH